MRIVTAESVRNKRVLVRLDLDVPVADDWQISDTTRLDAALPTLALLKDAASQLILCGHRGRPQGKVDEALSVKPLVPYLEEKLGQSVSFQTTFDKPTSNLTLLENLRFNPGEDANDPLYAKQLASLADVYVYEAFGAYRTAASTAGIFKLLPSFAGLHFAKEVVELSTILHNPIQPFVIIIGGAKLETKLPLIKTMEDLADAVLVGGLLAKEIKEKDESVGANVVCATLAESGKDIDKASIDRFGTIIGKAQTVVWNGTLGKYEDSDGIGGTKAIAQAIIDSGAYSIVGGGDTVTALDQLGLLEKFDFVSVGGGAMLEFLAGQPLPALEALQ